MRVAPRFNGPPGSGNGGVVAGRLAAYVAAPVCEVTLRRPPPLGVDLRVETSGGSARLLSGEALVAEAVPSQVDDAPPPPVTVERAREAAPAYAGLSDHPFPTCFVCGVDREDGLRLTPAPVGDGVVAAVWTPADDDPVMVWAALDCPGAWAADRPGRPLLLGRIALRSLGAVTPGDPHVVVGEVTGEDGRKVFTTTALYDGTGRLRALARATWIAPAA